MKFVKFGIFALTMGLFIASCGSGSGEAAKTDSAATHTDTMTAPAAPAPAAAPDTAAKAADTTKH